MNNYKGKNIKESKSIRETYNERKNKLKELKEKLSKMKPSDPEYTKLYNQIEKIKTTINKMKMRIAALLVAGAIAIGGFVGSAVAIENNEFQEDLVSGIETVEDINAINDFDGSYKEFKDKLLRYSQLLDIKNEGNLTNTEKKEIEYLKSYIKSHPEEINDLALEIVKAKIAENIGVDDPSLITTRFYHNIVNENGLEGTRTEISIDLKTGEHSATPIASYEKFTSANNPDRGFKSDEISKELYEALDCIAANQNVGDDLKVHNAKRALALALKLDPEKVLTIDMSKLNNVTIFKAGGEEFVLFE